MANHVLFASSLFLAFLHLSLVIYFKPPRAFAFSVLCGTFSSIWNHGVTNDVAKWSDRGMMAVGALVDFSYIASVPINQRPLLFALILAALAGYAGAKVLVRASSAKKERRDASHAASLYAAVFTSGNLPHLTAHLCLSLTHFVMITELAAHCASPPRAAAAGGFCW